MAGASSHYFSQDPADAGPTRELALHIQDRDFRFLVSHGVFSNSRLDPGTAILLDDAPPPPPGAEILDLGCGYGPIAVTLATSGAPARVWAVDVNDRAVELTEENARRNGLTSVVARRPEDVPADVRFDAIYSNPPIRVGKPVLHAMLLDWLGRLRPEGQGFLVVHKNLGSDSLQTWLNTQGFPTERLSSRRGYRVLAVSAQTAAPGEAARQGPHRHDPGELRSPDPSSAGVSSMFYGHRSA